MRGGGVRLYIIKKANKLNKYTGGGVLPTPEIMCECETGLPDSAPKGNKFNTN